MLRPKTLQNEMISICLPFITGLPLQGAQSKTTLRVSGFLLCHKFGLFRTEYKTTWVRNPFEPSVHRTPNLQPYVGFRNQYASKLNQIAIVIERCFHLSLSLRHSSYNLCVFLKRFAPECEVFFRSKLSEHGPADRVSFSYFCFPLCHCFTGISSSSFIFLLIHFFYAHFGKIST